VVKRVKIISDGLLGFIVSAEVHERLAHEENGYHETTEDGEG
jgi:hypothetical protein